MSQTILLTGGAGFIGSHIAVELLQDGYDVVIADDLSNSRADVIDRIEKITGRRPAFYRIDAADGAALAKVFDEQPIDAAVHLAGFKAVGESVQKPIEYYRNNLDTTLTLLETMRSYDVRRLVFSSSATVYGADNPVPYTEDMPAGRCTNPYGWTKWMIEQILADVARADAALSVVCLRYFNPVGAHESGLIGERPNGVPNNLMPISRRRRRASGRSSPSSETIMRRPTAPACATISTSPTSPAATSRPSAIRRSTWDGRLSTSVPATARACSSWYRRLSA